MSDTFIQKRKRKELQISDEKTCQFHVISSLENTCITSGDKSVRCVYVHKILNRKAPISVYIHGVPLIT